MQVLTLPVPAWGSDLATMILALETVRSKPAYASMPMHIFLQLKRIFQILETL